MERVSRLYDRTFPELNAFFSIIGPIKWYKIYVSNTVSHGKVITSYIIIWGAIYYPCPGVS